MHTLAFPLWSGMTETGLLGMTGMNLKSIRVFLYISHKCLGWRPTCRSRAYNITAQGGRETSAAELSGLDRHAWASFLAPCCLHRFWKEFRWLCMSLVVTVGTKIGEVG